MNNLDIINGRVIDPSQKLDGKYNIIVRDGKVADIKLHNPPIPPLEKGGVAKTSPPLEKGGRGGFDVIDAKGLIVSPGFVDIHTHLREPGHEYKEDIRSGAMAAAAGGFTTVCAMANTDPPNDNASVTEYILKRAKEVGLVNVLPIGAVSKGLKGEGLADILDQVEAGVVAFSDDGRSISNSLLLRRAMEYISQTGRPIVIHAEDARLSSGGVMHEGAVSTELGLMGIPSAAEEIDVARAIMLARLTKAHTHITHVSTAGSLELIRRAKRNGALITCDVTPHHLTLTHEAVRGYDTNTKVSPPLRTEKDCRALIKGLIDGTVDAIATDHAPHGIIEKELGFNEAAFGIVGLETALNLCLTLVEKKKITLARLIELLTIGPARSIGLHKGTLKAGSIADIVVFDPSAPVRIDKEKFYSKGRNTPFHGWKLKGKIHHTIVGGRVVYDHGKGMAGPS